MNSRVMEPIGRSRRWHRGLFTEICSFFTVTTSSRLIPWNSSKTSRQLVVRRLPRDMSSPITAGPITELLSSRWSLIGLERYLVLDDWEELVESPLILCDPKAA